MRALVFFAPLLLAAVAGIPRPGPWAPEEQTGVIRVSSNLVSVPVSVLDRTGKPVRGLTAGDFRIEEGGHDQRVVWLGDPGKTPVDLALLYDVSGSVRERFPFEQRAAAGFLKLVLKPGDSVSVFSMAASPRLVREPTTSLQQAEAAILSLEPTGEQTAFFDGVVEAAHHLALHENPGARRVVLAISDGEDNNSERHNLEDARRELLRSDCLFYSINPSGPAIRLNVVSLRGQQAMEALAADTGGAFLPGRPGDLDSVLRQIAAELQAQYLLGFYFSEARADGGFRRVSVTVPERPELRVRARLGYYAPKPMMERR
ncbi:MAG: VWA domain-containing protein [Acidobacteria bacterium]|jgi:VWFA-related protein|nr:VWA domain-containing protein [Acidobacteriota bacterium]